MDINHSKPTMLKLSLGERIKIAWTDPVAVVTAVIIILVVYPLGIWHGQRLASVEEVARATSVSRISQEKAIAIAAEAHNICRRAFVEPVPRLELWQRTMRMKGCERIYNAVLNDTYEAKKERLEDAVAKFWRG